MSKVARDARGWRSAAMNASATSARAMPGSGLGLAIVKQVVLKHGGSLRVEDTVPGGQPPGTSMHVVLPGRLSVSAGRDDE